MLDFASIVNIDAVLSEYGHGVCDCSCRRPRVVENVGRVVGRRRDAGPFRVVISVSFEERVVDLDVIGSLHLDEDADCDENRLRVCPIYVAFGIIRKYTKNTN